MTRSRIPRRLLPASLLAILALTTGGTAHAYWNGSGSGAGSATTGTTVAVTVSPGTAGATLFPGGQADVVLTVSNPNASPVRIGSLALAPGPGAGVYAVDPTHAGLGCTVATATLSFVSSSVGWTVPAKVGAVNGTLPITLTNALVMSVNAASACQGASFTVYVVVGP
jgi:hypothetical protein